MPTAGTGATAQAATDAGLTATAQAVASGQRVELVNQRTENMQVFANPSGNFTAEVSVAPVRVRRAGGWVPVDSTLVEQSNGSVKPRATSLDMTFSGGGSAPLAALRKGGEGLDISAPFTLPKPTLSGSTATYAEALPGVDLRVTAGADSYSELLVVKSREVAENPKLQVLDFALRGTGLSVRGTSSGGVEALDAFGNVSITGAPPSMWDSAGGAPTSSAGAAVASQSLSVGASEGDALRTVSSSVESSVQRLRVDPNFLTDAARVFPL